MDSPKLPTAKVICDSVAPNGARIVTMEVTMPRMILAEFNTHGRFSRNSASSRAIPVQTMLKRAQEDPFIPLYWGKNQKGMQADVELTETAQTLAQQDWLLARDRGVESAKYLLGIGVHKQITNRLLEPFLWHTVIVTATHWRNFYAQRCHKDAMPEMRATAEAMRAAHLASVPVPVPWDGWHLPFVRGIDEDELMRWAAIAEEGSPYIPSAAKISAARCARVSYLTHDGARNPYEDLALFDRLKAGGHMSPLQHPAQVFDPVKAKFSSPRSRQVRYPWLQLRKQIRGEAEFVNNDIEYPPEVMT